MRLLPHFFQKPSKSDGNWVSLRLGKKLLEPERICRRAMQLVVLEPFTAFRYLGNVARGNPPEAIMRLVHFLEPFGAVSKNKQMLRAVHKLAEILDRLPNRHVGDDKGIVIVGDVGGVAGFRLEAPNKARRRFSNRINPIELGHEVGDARIIDRSDQTSNVDLREMVVHETLPWLRCAERTRESVDALESL